MATIGVIAGDGVGPEVVREGLAILDDVKGLDGLSLHACPRSTWAASGILKTGEVLPDSMLDDLRQCDAIYLGAVGHPGVAPGILEKGILLRLRFAFHQYINLRPVRLFPGVETPIKGKGPDDIDLVVVRENNEDLYVGAGGIHPQGDARGGRHTNLDQHPLRGRALLALCV